VETITQGSSFLATAGLISVAPSAHFEFVAIRAIRVKVFYFQEKTLASIRVGTNKKPHGLAPFELFGNSEWLRAQRLARYSLMVGTVTSNEKSRSSFPERLGNFL